MVTITTLAAELDATDPGATVNAIAGFLGHRDYAMDEQLDAADEAAVRGAFAQ